MLFLLTEFEQYFNAMSLKKGLRLFEQDKVSFVERMPQAVFYFQVEDEFTVHIKKRADEILSYTCSCQQKKYCSHLAACMFYFQKDALGIEIKNKRLKKKQAKLPVNAAQNDFKYFLNGISHPDLLNFILEYSEDNELFREQINVYFSAGSEAGAYKYYYVQLKALLSPYQNIEKLNQKQINEIHHKITILLNKSPTTDKNYDHLFYLQLAVVSALPLIFNQRLVGDESGLLELIEHAKKEIVIVFEKKTGHAAVDATLEACVHVGEIKNKTGVEVLTFLVPYLATHLKTKKEFEKLRSLIEKRRVKLFIGAGFNSLLIARLQLAIKEAELFSTPFSFKEHRGTPEFTIATAGLYFCVGKIEVAFKLLESFYPEIKENFSAYWMHYLDYVIEKSREKNKQDIEEKYLREIMLHGLFIAPKVLERFFEIIPASNIHAEVDALVVKIKSLNREQSLDKISMLLLKDNRPDALIAQLKNYDNKFSLVHKIAIQKLPVSGKEILDLYTKHLIAALTDPTYSHYHEQIFVTAKKYFDQLETVKAKEVVSKVLDRLGALSHMHRFIRSFYPAEITVRATNKLRGESAE